MEPYIIHLLLTYKYFILTPIALVEGHVISLIAGFLSRMGLLNPFLSALCIIVGNLIGDVLLYWLGYSKGEAAIKKWGKYIHVTEESFHRVSEGFHKYKNQILFVSKVTNGFGLAMPILFTAGVVRIPFRVYIGWNILGEFVWTGILVAVGYFFGHLYTTVNNVIVRVGVIVFGIVAVWILFAHVRTYFKRKIQI